MRIKTIIYRLSILIASLSTLSYVNAQTLPVDPRKIIADHYPLDDEVDLRAIDLPSTRLTVIAGPYSFYIYDTKTNTLSHKLTPAQHLYEGEDAISATLSGFSFFDNEQFLFGHVQGYGIFCYQLSNSTQPKELRRMALSEDHEGPYYDNKGEYHVFFNPKEDERWDILLARSDVGSESTYIRQLYTRFEEIRYGLKDAFLQTDEQGEPEAAILPDGVIHIKLTDGTTWPFNLSRINQ